MKKTTGWMVKERQAICDYMNEKEVDCDPPQPWWVVLVGLDAIETEIGTIVYHLRLKPLLEEQADHLSFLVGTLSALGEVEDPLGEQGSAIRSASSKYVSRGSFASKITASIEFLRDQGSFFIGASDTLALQEVREVSSTIASLFLQACKWNIKECCGAG